MEAWGSNLNLFHKGFAREANDHSIVSATLKKPGIVLQRPVGTTEPSFEHAHLPKTLASAGVSSDKPSGGRKTAEKPHGPKIDDATTRKTALAYEREHQRQERERQKEEAARAKRERAIGKAQTQLDDARRGHDQVVEAIE